MKKTIRSLFCLTLVLTMMLAMSVVAFADGTPETTTLSKQYVRGGASDGESPKGHFVVYTAFVDMADAPADADIPTLMGHNLSKAFDNTDKANAKSIFEGDDIHSYTDEKHYFGKIELDAGIGDADNDLTTLVNGSVDLNNFNTIGTYWFALREDNRGTAGVTYDNRIYYYRVQVTHASEGEGVVRTMTLYRTSREASQKVDYFENDYFSGHLSISKQVAGNLGDPSKYFAVIVKFTAPEGKTVKSNIYYSGHATTETGGTYTGDHEIIAAGESGWTGSQEVTVWLKHGQTVNFTNIPFGVTYEITEADYSGDGYKHLFSYLNGTGEQNEDQVSAEDHSEGALGWNAAKVTGAVSNIDDEVSITNTKNSDLGVGVTLEDAPFIGIMILTVAAAAVFVVAKRKSAVR